MKRRRSGMKRVRPAQVRRRLTASSVAVVSVLALVSCTDGGDPTVDVLAASSFTDVADPLEALIDEQLGLRVRFSFGSSGSFYEQLRQGAPASVVITANRSVMDRMVQDELIERSVPIVRNELVIATAPTEAGRSIASLDDLANSDDAVIVLCASSAPCGEATDLLFAEADLEVSPASREPNVRATLTKVLLGEADAAVVYRTDVISRPELGVVEVGPSGVSVVGQAGARLDSADGAAIVELLTGDAARQIFDDAGFSAP